MRTPAMISRATLLAALFNVGCWTNGQGTHESTGTSPDNTAPEAVVDTPHVEVKVNKRYDDQGNLVAYDSSYVSIYSNGLGNATFMDSVFRDFRAPMGQRYPFLNDPGFNNLFFNDSLLFQDFFHDDFFRGRMDLNQGYMDRMMHEMDSLKNRWFQQQAQPPPADKGSGTI